jgi:hypothetical protein
VSGREPALNARAAISDAGRFRRAGVPAAVDGPGDIAYGHAYCKTLAIFLDRYCGRVEAP